MLDPNIVSDSISFDIKPDTHCVLGVPFSAFTKFKYEFEIRRP